MWRLVAGALLLTACSTPGPAGDPYVPAPVRAASAWASAFGDAAHSSPTTSVGPRTKAIRWQRRLIYTTHDRTLVALTDLGDRAELAWHYRTRTSSRSPPQRPPTGQSSAAPTTTTPSA